MNISKRKTIIVISINFLFFIVISIILFTMNKKIDNTKTLFINFYNEQKKETVNFTITEKDIIIGNSDAEVKFIIYAGYLCPHCKDFFLNTFPVIYKKYILEGKVCAVIRFITKPENKDAFYATKMAYCAQDQETFLSYNKAIYENNDSFNIELINKIITQNNIDSDCENEEDIIKNLQNNRKIAIEAGIRGTPSFIINGELLKGNRRLRKINEIIEKNFN